MFLQYSFGSHTNFRMLFVTLVAREPAKLNQLIAAGFSDRVG